MTTPNAIDTVKPLTIEPHADDNTVDYAAHELVKSARVKLNIAHSGFTLTLPVEMVPESLVGRGQVLTAPRGASVMLSFKKVEDVLAHTPAGELVFCHMSGCTPKRADKGLRALAAAGWTVAGVAWNRRTMIGAGDNVEVRDAFMGFRSPAAAA